MNIEEYDYLWTEKKDEYVLVNTEFGYGIVNKVEKKVLCISDEELEDIVHRRHSRKGGASGCQDDSP